jgi:predicted metal-dependent hydrolase
VLTNKKLKSLYKRYNKKYWKGRLPDISVRFADTEGAWGHTHFEGSEPVYIEINRAVRTWTRTVKFTLLHECCHVACPVQVEHGPRFDHEMLRLARAGAFHNLW